MVTKNRLHYSKLHHRILVEEPPKRLMYRYSRLVMGSQLLLSDLFVVFITTVIALFIWDHVNPTLEPVTYIRLLPILVFFGVLYLIAGLYPAVGLSQVDELRRLTIATTIIFLAMGTLTFYARNAFQWSRAVFGISWILSILLLPQGRRLTRWFACKNGLWGEPVAIIGNGPKGRYVSDQLIRYPDLGLNPVIVVDGNISRRSASKGILSEEDTQQLREHSWSLKDIQTVILVTDEIEPDFFQDLVHDGYAGFSRTIMLTGDVRAGSIWAEPYNIGGILGLGIKQNLLSMWQRVVKKLTDIFLILIFSPVLILLFAFLSLAIVLDSPGNIFYRQKRLGKGGAEIYIWKFRTMVHNADDILPDYLAKDPNLMQEWEEKHKLKDDPRVTRVGRFLRRTSLDELPQLFNVISGEMSLVGPRPIVEEEIPLYGKQYAVYKRVTPGLTGLWQVSGRNDLAYEERVRLDEFYVRNWSVWLDFYILENTPWAVLYAKGAY